MQIHIRSAHSADTDAIWNIIRQVIATGDAMAFAPDTPKEKMIPYWFSDDKHTYVAEYEGRIVGTFWLKDNQPDLGAHIANGAYMVDPDAKGLGIGYAMGAFSIEEARRLGYLAMQYNIVVKSNHRAVELWQRLGFQIIGEIPNAFKHIKNGFTNAYIMYRTLVWAAFCCLFFACGNPEKETASTAVTAPSTPLAQLFTAYYDEYAQLFPLRATSNGDYRYQDRLPNDGTQAFRDSLLHFYQKNLKAIEKFDRNDLSGNDQISYDVFQREMQMSIEGLKYPIWQIPATQFEGLHLTLGQYGSGESAQPFKTVKDYDDWLKRCAAFPAWADTAIANYRLGMASGWTLPRPCVVKMIPQLRDLATKTPEKNLFYQPIGKLPADIPAADKTRLITAYQQMIVTQLNPAFNRLADFLEKEYLPKSRTTSGVGAMPGGDAYYNWCVRFWTTVSDRTPNQIFETGQAEVARLRAEMERVKESTGYKGDLTSFFEFLKNDQQFRPFKTADEVLDSFTHIYTIIKPNVGKMFNLQPKAQFEIRRTEAFREASASAEYVQGTPDGSRPGIFYVPVPDAKTFAITSGMESLFLHEAIPGHHFQVMLQMENKSLPDFRRYAWYGAYGEGWALYTESLGKELGLYTNPYQYMGALSDEIHRAIRLVVDVGLHQKGWTREQAITYSLENEPVSKEGIISEIERYMANPAQALSYKTGAMQLRAMRTRYEKELGSKFSLADFHDEVLRDGCLPLDVLGRKMEMWMLRVRG